MKLLKNNDGYGLFITILLILLVSITGISLLTLSMNTNKTTINERKDQSTFYFAEAGINLEKSNIATVITNLDRDIKDYFNSLDYDSQVALLSSFNNDFETYYYTKMSNDFCSEFNSLFNPVGQSNKCSSNTFSSNFKLGKQFEKQPVVETTVLFDCSRSLDCTVNITSNGYFEDSPSNFRTVSQQLKIDANPQVSGGSSGNNGGSGGSEETVSEENGSGGYVNPLENFAALTNGNITLKGGATINGNAATNGGEISTNGGANITGSEYSTLPSSIKINSPNPLVQFLPTFPEFLIETGELVPYPPNNEFIYDKSNKTMIIKDGNFTSSTWMTPSYTLPLEKDTRFKDFILGNDNNLTINIGSNEVNLYVNNLNIENGDIKVTGSGKLNIFVKNKFNIGSNSVINLGENKINISVKDVDINDGHIIVGNTGILNMYVTDNLNIKGSFNQNGNPASANLYYNGSDRLDFNGSTKLYSSLYVKKSDVKLTGGAGLYGNFYSGGSNVDIAGGVPTIGQWFVAPYAKLDLNGGGNMKGIVITESITATGGTSISFGEPIVPNPAIPIAPPSQPYSGVTKSDLFIEGPLLENDR
ncbi:hypothetical protein JOD29_002091 [Lysinibacillus composti]|uniref:Type 4 fimbrial biogenesis protein PilX N-terminal domain-containing protein n=1 Tax=Lysinibacillus composti TaxID=720633 RepID=A0A3N9UDS4_9BACI|nr:hypothetical protein [Lysinibacillus composti]MBM7608825.1 hypothetical protein [Lysinibacillus composti]RQW74407.1 hypothetical protein EBB45_10985 [Lysinibacillus composti]